MRRRNASLRINNNLGMLALALWVLLNGLVPLWPQARALSPVLPFLALAAGALLLMGR
jgi:hypothetical protein